MPKLKPEELESRRQEIIDAARACFLRSGFHRTTTDEICREAAITPGGLYHYFGGKNEIIAAVIQQSTNEVIGRLQKMLDSGRDIRSVFADVSNFFVETLQDPNLENVVKLDIEIWAEALKNPKLYDISRESWAMRRHWLEDVVNRGLAEGIYRGDSFDPRGYSSLLLAILVGLRLGRVLWKDDFDLNGAIAALFLVYSGRITMDFPSISDTIVRTSPAPAELR